MTSASREGKLHRIWTGCGISLKKNGGRHAKNGKQETREGGYAVRKVEAGEVVMDTRCERLMMECMNGDRVRCSWVIIRCSLQASLTGATQRL